MPLDENVPLTQDQEATIREYLEFSKKLGFRPSTYVLSLSNGYLYIKVRENFSGVDKLLEKIPAAA
ncbi:MAG: hypothetical protein JWN50_611 [Parcubacteria group bacterium]|nr:hypothetical protein [Parcubacteria group bacterium]